MSNRAITESGAAGEKRKAFASPPQDRGITDSNDVQTKAERREHRRESVTKKIRRGALVGVMLLMFGCASVPVPARAQMFVYGTNKNLALANLDTTILFSPTNEVLITGFNVSAGPPIYTRSTNGYFWQYLDGGDYSVSFPEIPWRTPFFISVSNCTSCTNNIISLMSPPRTYTYTASFDPFEVAAGSNITIVTNGMLRTISSSGGSGSGDMVLADQQTVTGNKIFQDDALKIQATGNSGKLTLNATASAVNRTITFPSTTGTVAIQESLTSVYQPLDADLTAIAALATTSYGRQVLISTDSAQVRSYIGLVIGTDVQAYDADLATIAGLTATTDNFIQSKSGAWASRTIAQVKTDLGLTGVNSGDQTITLTGAVTGSGTGSIATTPAATITTNNGTLTGLMKGDGARGVTAATSGTDYAPATSGSSILAGNGSGGTTAATATQVNTLIGGSIVTNQNATLTSGRVTVGDGARGIQNATASGAVPIDADGTATTAAQLNTVKGGDTATNQNATLTSAVLIGDGARGVKNTVVGTVPINGDGTATTFAQVNSLSGTANLSDSHLSANVPLLNAQNNFSGSNRFSGSTAFNGAVYATNTGTGTPVAALNVDANGKVITNAVSSGSGGGNAYTNLALQSWIFSKQNWSGGTHTNISAIHFGSAGGEDGLSIEQPIAGTYQIADNINTVGKVLLGGSLGGLSGQQRYILQGQNAAADAGNDVGGDAQNIIIGGGLSAYRVSFVDWENLTGSDVINLLIDDNENFPVAAYSDFTPTTSGTATAAAFAAALNVNPGIIATSSGYGAAGWVYIVASPGTFKLTASISVENMTLTGGGIAAVRLIGQVNGDLGGGTNAVRAFALNTVNNAFTHATQYENTSGRMQEVTLREKYSATAAMAGSDIYIFQNGVTNRICYSFPAVTGTWTNTFVFMVGSGGKFCVTNTANATAQTYDLKTVQ